MQLCIVHMIRNSLKFVSYKDYKEVTSDLKPIYGADDEEQADAACCMLFHIKERNALVIWRSPESQRQLPGEIEGKDAV